MSVQFENKITLGNALTIGALASLAPIVAVAAAKGWRVVLSKPKGKP